VPQSPSFRSPKSFSNDPLAVRILPACGVYFASCVPASSSIRWRFRPIAVSAALDEISLSKGARLRDFLHPMEDENHRTTQFGIYSVKRLSSDAQTIN
jgi:hypothetical protein